MSMSDGQLTSLAAAAGAADTALFVVRRPGLFRTNPPRALWNVAVLAAWSALVRRSRTEKGRAGTTSQALSVALFATNGVLLAVHVARGIVKPRVFVGPTLSAIALADVLRRRRG